jgi:hypothetical protein
MNKSNLQFAISGLHLRCLAGRERGSILLGVMIVMIFLAGGLGTYLSSLSNIEHLQDQRIMNDRAFMAAESGLAKAIVQLQGMATPPGTDQSWNEDVPAEQFAPFQSVTVNVYVQTINADKRWTLAATATAADDSRNPHFCRRVQTTLFQENFAKYEYFVNDYGGVWSPGYLQFEGFNSVFLGPYHSNSGVAFWPNLWMVNEATTAAPKGVRYFANYGTYVAGVYGKPDANDYANILQYYSSEFPNAPQFYKGLNVLPKAIELPNSSKANDSTAPLRNNAGLTLPAGYKDYDATKGANFTVELQPGNKKDGNGTVEVRQYLGLDKNNKPTYGKKETYSVDDINNALVVYGDIKSIEGTLDGKLTVAAFAKASNPDGLDPKDPNPGDPGGSIDITGSLNYASRPDDMSYTDAPGLYTADHTGINQDYVATLLDQMKKVTDVLGLFSEADVTIKEKDLDGNLVAADVKNPIHIDAVVMATGSATDNSQDGGFAVENFLTRAKGAALTLGGQIQNHGYSWALFSGNTFTNGILQTRLWDQRAATPGGAPPFFPTTGNFQVVPQSWRSSYVENATTVPTFFPH